jgi:hypothetical protein
MSNQADLESKGHESVTGRRGDMYDIGQSLYDQGLAMDPDHREVVAKKVKKKLDRILLPMVSSAPWHRKVREN